MRNRNRSGFTLIELLVVIAIIAMLAAILVPAVNSALDSAAMVQTVSNGSNIYKSAFAGQMEDVVFSSEGSGWPKKGEWDSSTAYFKDLVTNGIMSVSFDFFSAKGLPAQKSTNPNNFDKNGNAWKLVQGLEECAEGFPFLFTRNANIQESTLNQDFDTTDKTVIDLDGKEYPFQSKGMVAVLKGGAAFSLKGQKQLYYKNLNPAGKQDDADIEIVGP